MIVTILVALGVVVWTTRRIYSNRNVVNCLFGPKPASWIYGNLRELLLTQEYGEQEFDWQETYGPVYPIKGCFGESRLMVSDPKTIKYLLNNTSVFVCGPTQRKAATALIGPGNIFLAHGDDHRHLRNIMNPAFSAGSVQASLVMIRDTARKLADKWESLGPLKTTVDVSRGLHHAVMDIMGDGLLEYHFDALMAESEASSFQRSVIDSVSSRTNLGLLLDAAMPYIPNSMVLLGLRLPFAAMRIVQDYHRVTNELSLDLIRQKRREGQSENLTFIGRLIRSNAFDDTVGVPDADVGIHLRSIFIAGTDSSAATIGWTLYKLAQMTDFQQQLREEIQKSDPQTQEDYDNMPLLNAMINEVLRLYSPLPLAEREATEDCILPLSQPIVTANGAKISELPIKKGQFIYVAIASYHRLRSIWGPDAREFRPSRWLEKEPRKGPALGPRSLLAFIGGTAVCVGWRLGILQTQVLVTELVRKFALSLPDDDTVRVRLAITLVATTVDGTQHLPLNLESVQ